VHKQLGNAQEKLERAQRHAEEKRQASQQTIERLQREYEKMDVERRENDKQVEELRMEAGDIESKASLISCSPHHHILIVLCRWRSI
jgi:kinetochore protein Nuf2